MESSFNPNKPYGTLLQDAGLETNFDVDGATLNTSTFGATEDQPLKILFTGDSISGPVCDPIVIPGFVSAIQTFLSNGGVVLVVSEVSGCRTEQEQEDLSDFLSDIGSSMSFNNTSVEGGCAARGDFGGGGPQTHPLMNGVEVLAFGGSTTINGGTSLWEASFDQGTVIAAEAIGDGWVVAIGDANFFDCWHNAPFVRETADNPVFLNNLCNAEPEGA